MAYLTRKKIKGTTYYYAEESERRDGKSRRKWQKYLGTLSRIIEAVEGVPSQPECAEIFQLGGPAAYLNAAQQTNMLNILNNVFHKREQGPSIGLYLTLAAINRGINAVSKRSMWGWFKDTILLRAFPEINQASLSSQRFWDNMSGITDSKIKSAWMKIVHHVIEQEKIDLSCASYDGTNFYTFIGSFNERSIIAKRGKNKQGRKDLRQINYALFCTRKDHFPLYFDIFEGNRHDSKEFSHVIDKFFKDFEKKIPAKDGMTIVFDKGNNSKENIQKFIDGSIYHFVGSVKPSDHNDLSLMSNEDKQLKPLLDPRLDHVKAFRTQKNIYGRNLTVIVTFNNNLYSAQVQSINNEINKSMGKLSIIAYKLDERVAGKVTKGRKPTKKSVEKQVSKALSGQHMKKLIKINIDESNDTPTMSYSLNTENFSELSDTYLGKNILITDNHDWKTEDIVITYRSQYIIEDVFKQMKDRKQGTWWPMYHWTDNMIKVHGFYCSLSLLLRALIMKKARDSGMKISMSQLHESLFGIREVINIFSKHSGKQKSQTVISKLDKTQDELFELFEMKQYLSS